MEGYGLVLGGGGVKGSYEIGVWKALQELDISIVAVAGTSVGALNGSMIVQGDYDKAYELWMNISMDAVIKIDNEISKLGKDSKSDGIAKIIKTAIHSGGLDITPLKQLLKENINEEKIRNSKMEFGIVTFSLTDLKPIIVFKEDIPKGKIVDYLLASSALPVFKPLEIDGVRFLDGAFYDNLPVSLMIEKAIYNIITVDVSGFGVVRKVRENDLNIIQIKNSESLGYDLEFNPDIVKRNIEIGYYDTMKVFGKYKGKNYYIIDLKSKFKFDLSQLKLIYRYLGIDWDKKSLAQNKFIIYKLIRNIKKHSHIKKIKKFSEFIVAAAEITAEIMEIDRIQAFTLEELINEIIEHYKNKKNEIGFLDFSNYIIENIIMSDDESFGEKIRKTISESKFTAIYSVDINDLSERMTLYRRFLALTFPKLCIANIFIALLNSQYAFDS